MTSQLLAGVRVVELTEVWAGPMAGSLLGDLGADVIKVESYPRNSITRALAATGPAAEGDGPIYERSPIHHLSNRNKRNITLNLRSEPGIEAFRRLLATADVFFEGYSSGTIERMGFGWEVCRSLNPRLSMISMPGWGVAGPYRGYVTLGSGLDAAAGHTALRGYPDGPMEDVHQIYHSDATGALTLVFAAVTALRRREQTGAGSFIDLSQIEALAWQLPGAYAEWTMLRRQPRRLGNVDPHVVPHGCYRAAGGEAGEDAWVVIAAENDGQWAAVARAAGHPEWAEPGHAWATVTGRLAARASIDAAMGAFAASGTAEAIADTVQHEGAIAAPVIGPASVLGSPQHAARAWLQTVEHRHAGVRLFPGFLWHVAPDAASWDRPCGLVGEHNDEVLAELGFSSAAIAELEAAGVIGRGYALPR
ncbi:MAG: CoA transferase [Chloroflexi bacterium]|nr:CoA transferase [Chloroflexota bacterium]